MDKAPATELPIDAVDDAALESPFAIISPTVARPPTPEAIRYFRTKLKYLSPKEQLPYHRRLLGIFATQLLLTWALVGVWTYLPEARDPLRSFFQDQEGCVAIPFGVALVLLLVLYFIRIHSPWNWFVLLLFSVAQSVSFAALGVAFDTNVGFFNCGAVFCQVLIMILLAGVRLKSRDVYQFKLLRPICSAPIAFVIVVALATALYGAYGRSLVTPRAFMYSLIFQFVMMLWLAIDTSSIYDRIYVNDTSQGAINLYTDLVVMLLTVASVILMALLCGAILEECGCDCCSSNRDFWDYYALFVCFNCSCDCDCKCCGECKCCERKKTALEAYPVQNHRIQRV